MQKLNSEKSALNPNTFEYDERCTEFTDFTSEVFFYRELWIQSRIFAITQQME